MSTTVPFHLTRGDSPLLVSIPHLGTTIPQEDRGRYVPRALEVEDADWHLDRLYHFLPDMNATVLKATLARYVIDFNRPPDNTPMYPGASNTELCPTRFFTGEPLYLAGQEPSEALILKRRQQYWQAYHDALAAEIERIRARHGFVLLWDAHSIRSVLPWLFEGRLPRLNFGTASGASALPAIAEALDRLCQGNGVTDHVINGRFKGGYITRQYGAPAQHVHAVQLEMCQDLYMNESSPYEYRPETAALIQPLLEKLVRSALDVCRASYER